MDHQNLPHIMLEGLKYTQTQTGVDYPQTQDELFDFILTFLEGLKEHKPTLNSQLTLDKCGVILLEYSPVIHQLTKTIFAAHIKTHLDHLTVDILFLKILYVWINDETPDISATMDEINYLTRIIFSSA